MPNAAPLPDPAPAAAEAVAAVKVGAKVDVGPSSIAGGSVTVVAYVLALIAFAQGARDEATMSALTVGTIALVTTIAARVAQAVSGGKAAAAAVVATAPAPAPVTAEDLAQIGDELVALRKGLHVLGRDQAVDQAGEWQPVTAATEGPVDELAARRRDELEQHADELVLSKDHDVDDDDPGDDDDEPEVTTDEELEHAPDDPDGGPPEAHVALVTAHAGLRDDEPKRVK
jgi:hypothetical protein